MARVASDQVAGCLTFLQNPRGLVHVFRIVGGCLVAMSVFCPVVDAVHDALKSHAATGMPLSRQEFDIHVVAPLMAVRPLSREERDCCHFVLGSLGGSDSPSESAHVNRVAFSAKGFLLARPRHGCM